MQGIKIGNPNKGTNHWRGKSAFGRGKLHAHMQPVCCPLPHDVKAGGAFVSQLCPLEMGEKGRQQGSPLHLLGAPWARPM